MRTMRKRCIQFLLLFLLLASWLGAQNTGTRDNFREEVSRIEDRIRTARELLKQYPSEANATRLQAIVEQIQTASDLWQKQRRVQARQMLQNARANIDKLLTGLLNDPLRRQRTQLDEYIIQIENRISGVRNQQTDRWFQQIKERQNSGQQAERNGDYSRAIEEYRVGISLCQKAVDWLQQNDLGSGSGNTPGSIVERQRFMNTAERVRDAVETSGNNAARKVYDQAVKQGRNADAAYQNGQQKMAVTIYNEGMKLLLRALDLSAVTTTLNTRNLQLEYETVNNLIETAHEQIKESPRPGFQHLLQRAERSRTNAAAAIESGNLNVAKIQLRISRGLLNKIFRTVQSASLYSEDRVQQEIERLKQDIQKFEAEYGAANAEAKELVRMAQLIANRAESGYLQNFYRLALQRVLVAQRFLTQAEMLVDSGKSTTLAAAERHIVLLEQRLTEARNSTLSADTVDQFTNAMLEEAERMLIQAREKLNMGQFNLAYELADTGMDLVKKSLRTAQ